METVRQVGIRLTAGYSDDEVAITNRDNVRHVELPKGPIATSWVKLRMQDVRKEIAATHSDLMQD